MNLDLLNLFENAGLTVVTNVRISEYRKIALSSRTVAYDENVDMIRHRGHAEIILIPSSQCVCRGRGYNSYIKLIHNTR